MVPSPLVQIAYAATVYRRLWLGQWDGGGSVTGLRTAAAYGGFCGAAAHQRVLTVLIHQHLPGIGCACGIAIASAASAALLAP